VQGVVLMVGLGVVEALQWFDLGHNLRRKDMDRIQLRNVGEADPALFLIVVEDRRAVGCAYIRPGDLVVSGRGRRRNRSAATVRR